MTTNIKIDIEYLENLLVVVKNSNKHELNTNMVCSKVCKSYLKYYFKENTSINLKHLISILCEDSMHIKKINNMESTKLEITKLLDISICCLMIKISKEKDYLNDFIIDMTNKAESILDEIMQDDP